ncbi:MAG: hypothetical protein ACKO13_10840, partial [Cytophagales bacterium]
ISEGIGSRLEFVTTAETPEVEIELLKGKGKEKEIEVVNLEEIVDVKGWKALGNRLSQFKVTKVKPLEEPEDNSASAEDDNEATGTAKGTESPKKKNQATKKMTSSRLLKKTAKQPSSVSQKKSPQGRSSTGSPQKQKAHPKKSSKPTSLAKTKKK